jgi:hypothetical protein
MYTGPQTDTETCGHDGASAEPQNLAPTHTPVDAPSQNPLIKEPMVNGILTASHPAYRASASAPYPHPYAPARPRMGVSTSPYVRMIRPKVYS